MYALIQNNQIKVGPRDWRYYFFKQYLDSNNLDSSQLPISEPSDRKVITADWKIIPVTQLDTPEYNQNFEQLAGPFWTIFDEYITGYYTVADLPLESAKNKLKEKVTNTRYIVEVGGCQFTFSDDTEVTLYTTREDRSVYLQAYQIMEPGQSIVFKFEGAVFKSVTREELGTIVATGAAHIQAAFDWEAQKYSELDACETLDDLKLVDINYPESD
jgi:hypothetical protein